MARVSFTVTDEELARFKTEAESRGMSLSAWMRALAKGRVVENGASASQVREEKRLHTDKDREAFFHMIDALHGPDAKPTPTWEEINQMLEERMREKYPQA